MKRLRVRDRVMTSHDACTSGTSQILTVAAVEDAGSYSSYRRWWSAVCDKVLERTEHSAVRNSPAVPAVISRSLLQKTVTEHLLFRKLCAGRCQSNRHQNTKQMEWSEIDNCEFHLFLQLKKFFSSQRQRFQNDREAEMIITVVPIPGGRHLRHRDTKAGPTLWKMCQFLR